LLSAQHVYDAVASDAAGEDYQAGVGGGDFAG
jgi:hypothetical protein